ncbi:MAG: hypothetical protein J5835_08355 [Bacteroidales bacterium]|nr:hypothetical protein [Bacteroidales bacterium]
MNLNKLFNDFAKDLASRTSFLTEDSVRYLFYSEMLKQDPITDHYVMEVPFEMMRNTSFPYCLKTVQVSQPNTLTSSPSGKWLQELDMLYDVTNKSTLSEDINDQNDDAKNPIICIEVKFHRKSGLSTNRPEPEAAGRILNDMRRLQLLQPTADHSIIRLFVYVTDDDMHNYLSAVNRSTGSFNPSFRIPLSQFYKNGGPFPVTLPPTMPPSFYTQANHSFNPASPFTISANMVFSRSIYTVCPVFLNGNCHISIFEIL